jgi:hypothetical protein
MIFNGHIPKEKGKVPLMKNPPPPPKKDTMSEWIETQVQDSVVQSVINKFKQRSEVGIKKYGTTLERNDLTTLNWIEEAQAEAMDFCLYLERLKRQYEK